MRKTLPDVRLLRQRLHCNAETGRLSWRERAASDFAGEARDPAWCARVWNKRYAGKEAFTAVNSSGYRYGSLEGRTYLAHRIIWKMALGEEPPEHLDHKNRIRTDNRLQNLREATQVLNSGNARKFRGASRYRGVSPKGRKWLAAIQGDNGLVRLGVFEDEAEAARAYDFAASAKYGEFANLNFGEAA